MLLVKALVQSVGKAEAKVHAMSFARTMDCHVRDFLTKVVLEVTHTHGAQNFGMPSGATVNESRFHDARHRD